LPSLFLMRPPVQDRVVIVVFDKQGRSACDEAAFLIFLSHRTGNPFGRCLIYSAQVIARDNPSRYRPLRRRRGGPGVRGHRAQGTRAYFINPENRKFVSLAELESTSRSTCRIIGPVWFVFYHSCAFGDYSPACRLLWFECGAAYGLIVDTCAQGVADKKFVRSPLCTFSPELLVRTPKLAGSEPQEKANWVFAQTLSSSNTIWCARFVLRF